MRILKLLIIVLMLATLTGCVVVQPWEREYLADPIMSMENEVDDDFHDEIEEIREGSALGKGGSGGGCGCN